MIIESLTQSIIVHNPGPFIVFIESIPLQYWCYYMTAMSDGPSSWFASLEIFASFSFPPSGHWDGFLLNAYSILTNWSFGPLLLFFFTNFFYTSAIFFVSHCHSDHYYFWYSFDFQAFIWFLHLVMTWWFHCSTTGLWGIHRVCKHIRFIQRFHIT